MSRPPNYRLSWALVAGTRRKLHPTRCVRDIPRLTSIYPATRNQSVTCQTETSGTQMLRVRLSCSLQKICNPTGVWDFFSFSSLIPPSLCLRKVLVRCLSPPQWRSVFLVQLLLGTLCFLLLLSEPNHTVQWYGLYLFRIKKISLYFCLLYLHLANKVYCIICKNSTLYQMWWSLQQNVLSVAFSFYHVF